MGVRTRTFENLNPRRKPQDKTKSSGMDLGTLSATATRTVFKAPSPVRIKKVYLISETAVSAINGHSWTFQLTNKTQTLDLLASAKSTESGGLAAFTGYEITPDQNQVLAEGDVLAIVCTKTGSAPTLTYLDAYVEYEIVTSGAV